MTVAAIWLGYITHRAREQRTAVARIRELQGRVVYDYQYQVENSAANPLPQTPPGWPWLRHLIGDEYFQDVAMIFLDNTPVSDADLRILCKLRGTRSISLRQGNITDEGLKSLEQLTRLTSLDLRETKITSAGLAQFKPPLGIGTLFLANTRIGGDGTKALSQWSNLSMLGLEGTDVTAEDIQHLAELKNLQTLVIQRTKLDDSAVPNLGKLTALVELYLDDSQISGTGLLSLHDQLPNCRIEGNTVECEGSTGPSPEHARWKQITTRFIALDREKYIKLLILSVPWISDGHLLALEELKHVEAIDLRRTQVTDAGVNKLQRALPKCKIVRE
ncbi:MAG: leucine-rich repeat domain-containing protein [Pirellulaceae bacterium]